MQQKCNYFLCIKNSEIFHAKRVQKYSEVYTNRIHEAILTNEKYWNLSFMEKFKIVRARKEK